MLTQMRKHGKFLNISLWLVIAAFLSTIVFVWGVGDQGSQEAYAAKVGKSVISYAEFQEALESMAQYRQLMGAEDDGLFQRKVLDELIYERLLLLEAEKLSIPVSDADVAAVIMSDPSFNVNGQFDVNRYSELLRMIRKSPAQFENEVKQQITTAKLKKLITGSLAVTDKEIELEYIYQNTGLSLSYFYVDYNAYSPKVNPTEEDLQAYFDANKERYRVDAKVKLKFIQFNPEDFVFKPDISEELLKSRYTKDIRKYIIPEQVDVYGIFVDVKDWNNSEDVLAANIKINKAIEELDRGVPFKQVALKYSESPSIRDDKGFIGRYAKPDRALQQQEVELFNLEPGKHTSIIQNEYSLAVFTIDNRTEEYVEPFEVVKTTLKKEISDEQRKSAYRNYLYNISKDVDRAGNLTAYLRENSNYKTLETDYIYENDNNPLFEDSDLRKLIFSLKKASASHMVNIGDTSYIFELVDRVESFIPEFSSVRGKVISDYKSYKAYELALSDVDSQISSTNDLSSLSRHFKSRIVKYPPFKRIDSLPDNSWAEDMESILFSANKGDIIKYEAPEVGKIYIVRIDDKNEPDFSDLEYYREAITESILSLKRIDALNGFVQQLREKYPVKINERFL